MKKEIQVANQAQTAAYGDVTDKRMVKDAWVKTCIRKTISGKETWKLYQVVRIDDEPSPAGGRFRLRLEDVGTLERVSRSEREIEKNFVLVVPDETQGIQPDRWAMLDTVLAITTRDHRDRARCSTTS